MVEWWQIALVGGFGGLMNALLVEPNTLWMPQLKGNGHTGLDPGFLGNVAVGIAAALLTYFLGLSNQTPLKQLGVALAAGIAGSSFLANYVLRTATGVLEDKNGWLKTALKKRLGR